ncbi:MAG: VWA domain-containing protein [Paracoccaceae bacterium]
MVEPIMEAPVVVEPAPMMAEPLPGSRTAGPRPRRGVVTAGDIEDGLNLAAFLRYQKRATAETGLPRADLGGAFAAQLVDASGKPAPGIRVTLSKPGAAEPFYDGYSGTDGRVLVYPALHGAGHPKAVQLRAFGEGQTVTVQRFGRAGGPAQQVVLPAPVDGYAPDFLDLAFVIDTTGSMGDEIAWLTREFAGLVRQARQAAPGANIRFGLVAYRDQGDDYVVRNFGFTQNQRQMQGWLAGLDANGGGDYPEAADRAMEAAAGLTWRRGKGERLLFHIADAPAHKAGAKRYLAASRKLALAQVQVFGLGASGTGPEAEFLMRQAAAQSNGRYLFLTDDSGVGLAHGEPSVACYKVTRLKSLLSRVLVSELTGHRREAPGSQVIREVGSYRDGVCRQ